MFGQNDLKLDKSNYSASPNEGKQKNIFISVSWKTELEHECKNASLATILHLVEPCHKREARAEFQNPAIQ